MSSLSEVMNRVSRLVIPALRQEEELKRINTEISACEDFLARKKQLEAEIAQWNQDQPKIQQQAEDARETIASITAAGLKECMHDISAAAKLLDESSGYIADIDKQAFGRFCRDTNMAFHIAAFSMIEISSLDRTFAFKRFIERDDIDVVIQEFSRNLENLGILRRSFLECSANPKADTPLTRNFFFKELTVGHKTERRAGYPLVFLTEKVRVPILKRVEISPVEKDALIQKHLDAIACLENKLPDVMRQRALLAIAIKKIDAYENRKRSADSAVAQLKEIPDHLGALAEAHIRDMKKMKVPFNIG